MKPRILVASDFNAKDRAHFGVSYELCRVITETDDADLIAPGLDNYLVRTLGRFLPPHDGKNVQRDFNRLLNALRKTVGLRNAPSIEPVSVSRTYDLFLFVAWSPQSLVELDRINNWRSRCKCAVAYIFELWSTTLEQDRAYLKLLDQFDYVFLLHGSAVPKLASYTRAHCSFLPTGVDCLTASPYPSPPERVVDVYSIGNRASEPHRQLVALSESRGLFYLYDSLASSDSPVKDWREHRLLVSSLIKRTRYFIAFSPADTASSKVHKIAGEHVLPSRLFEGAAGGAIMLGSAPRCPEFHDHFDWPDAVIEISPHSVAMGAVIEELDAQPDRIARARRMNITRSLLKHDWVYRWESILNAVGLEPLPQLRERRSRLRDIAATACAASHKGAAVAETGHVARESMGLPRKGECSRAGSMI